MIRMVFALLLALAVAPMAAAQGAPPAVPPVAPAGVPANPYAATVPVAGTSDAQRDAAIGAALAQVLQGLAPGLTVTPELQAKATGYVRSFRYSRAAGGSGLELEVEFDPRAMARLVAAASAAPSPTAAPGTPGTPGTPGASTPAAAPVAQHGSATLWIAGIDDSHAFATLLSVLRGEDALDSVSPVAAAGNGVLVRVDYEQPLATVLAALTGPGGHLATSLQAHPGADASLQWVP